MKRLYVFADFDWLKEPRLIGELSYESLRSSGSYGFCYSDDWLRDYGNNANPGHGYLDIVDFILQNCTSVEDNLQELYRRVAFNICIGNSDDHFRNHGFLLTAKGWTLAPAYDMNPTLNEYQSLLVSSTSNKAELGILLDTCEDYMLNRNIAEKIISEVIEAIKGWREMATRLSISKREMGIFSGVLDERCKVK